MPRFISRFRPIWRLAVIACLVAALGSSKAAAVEQSEASTSSYTISMDLLKYPLAEKDRKVLIRALDLSDAGDHYSAVAVLDELLVKRPKTEPYVTSLRGAQFLLLDRWTDALADLERATTLLPHMNSNRTNLAVALTMTGQLDRAAQEARESLRLGFTKQAGRLLAILEGRLTSTVE